MKLEELLLEIHQRTVFNLTVFEYPFCKTYVYTLGEDYTDPAMGAAFLKLSESKNHWNFISMVLERLA